MKPYKYDGSNWILKDNTVCDRISVGPNYAWSIDQNNNIKKYDGTNWTAVTGVKAKEIAVGFDGSVFIINTTETAFTGYTV
jgi:hypothetical protein